MNYFYIWSFLCNFLDENAKIINSNFVCEGLKPDFISKTEIRFSGNRLTSPHEMMPDKFLSICLNSSETQVVSKTTTKDGAGLGKASMTSNVEF